MNYCRLKYASLLHVISPEQYNLSHNFVMIIMNAMQHQLNGESATNSHRGSPSPVPPDCIHTAQNSNRIRAVNRRKWSKDDNRIAMECFIRSKPENKGYRRRMINIWQDRGMFENMRMAACRPGKTNQT